MQKLSEQEVVRRAAQLTGWNVQGGKLHREFKFRDFKQAMAFMAAAIDDIEKLDHHPEWANVYNHVSVDLVTHSANGITNKDFELAGVLDSVAANFQ